VTRTRPSCVVLLVLATALGCQSVRPEASGHPLAGRIYDGRAGAFVTDAELYSRAAATELVLLGEKHDNPEHHRLQASVIDAIAESGRRPAVVWEMITRDRDPVLRSFSSVGSGDLAELAQRLEWSKSGWPEWEMYQPIAEAAQRHGLVMVAGDLAGETRSRLHHAGFDGLRADERSALRLDGSVPDPVYAVLAETIERAHCGHAMQEHLPRMVEVQHARDAQLALSLREAVTSVAGGGVLIAGTGHVDRNIAVPRFLLGRDVLVVAFVEVTAGETAPERYAAQNAVDLIWFTERVDSVDPCEAFREQLEEHFAPQDERQEA